MYHVTSVPPSLSVCGELLVLFSAECDTRECAIKRVLTKIATLQLMFLNAPIVGIGL